MLDCVGKRLTFVQEAATALQLPNAATLWSRAEDAGRLPQHREAGAALRCCLGHVCRAITWRPSSIPSPLAAIPKEVTAMH